MHIRISKLLRTSFIFLFFTFSFKCYSQDNFKRMFRIDITEQQVVNSIGTGETIEKKNDQKLGKFYHITDSRNDYMVYFGDKALSQFTVIIPHTAETLEKCIKVFSQMGKKSASDTWIILLNTDSYQIKLYYLDDQPAERKWEFILSKM